MVMKIEMEAVGDGDSDGDEDGDGDGATDADADSHGDGHGDGDVRKNGDSVLEPPKATWEIICAEK